MKTEFCVIGSDYVTEGGKPAVRLWGRTKSGKSILAVDRGFRPYFYAHFEGNGNEFREKAMKLEIDGEKPSKVEVVERNILGRPSKLLKITVTLPPSVPKFRELVKEWKGVKEEYEYSIPFHKRYMIDNDISPMGWVEAEGRAVDGPADINIELESVRNLDGPIADPKVFRLLAFRVLNGKSSLKIEAAGTGPARTITGKRAVEEFVSLVKRADPDFIIGYGSDRGDFPALSSHALEKKEGLALGRDGSKVAFTKRAYYSSAEVEGRCHIDILDFVENIMARGISAETTSIEDVGSELLGMKAGNSAETILKLGELLLPQIFEIGRAHV